MRNAATLLSILFALAAAAAVGSAVDGYVRARADLAVKPGLSEQPMPCLLGTPCSEQVPDPPHPCLVANQPCPADAKVLPVVR